MERVVARLREEFGATGVFLYGSAARGDMDEESDIDLVAVLPRRDWRVQCAVCDLCLEEDVGLGRIISCMVCTKDDLQDSWASPWMENVKGEGVSL